MDQPTTLSKKEAQVAQYIDPNSPLFKFYTGPAPLSDLLNQPDIRKTPLVDFSEALRAHIDTSKYSHVFLRRRAEMKGTTLLSHIINRSGSQQRRKMGDKKYYEDTRYPPIIPAALLKMAQELNPHEIAELAAKLKDSTIPIETTGRISIVFYDDNGDILLRRFSNLSSESTRLRLAQEYLQEPAQGVLARKLNYLSGILQDRYDTIAEQLRGGKIRKENGVPLLRHELVIARQSKLSMLLEKVSRPLMLTTLYLFYPPNPEEVKSADGFLRAHIDKISDPASIRNQLEALNQESQSTAETLESMVVQ